MRKRPREARTVEVFAYGSSATKGQKFGWNFGHVVFGFSLGAIISFPLLYFHYLSSEAACMLIVFNFLFVSLVFPLNGALATKVLMLSLGNMVGVFWNYIFCLFVYGLADYFGVFFRILYPILSPLANLIWIVTFYSMGLTFLASSEIRQAGGQT